MIHRISTGKLRRVGREVVKDCVCWSDLSVNVVKMDNGRGRIKYATRVKVQAANK